MFFTQASSYEGEPVRLYRSPREIRRDINEIDRRIKAADSRLNIPNMLGELMTRLSEGDPERLIPEIRVALDEAESVLTTLGELRDSLDALNRELEETVWISGA